MKLHYVLFLALPMAACGGAPDTYSESESPVGVQSSPLTQERVNALKSEIRRISLANIERTDNLGEVRAQLDPLVKELADSFAGGAEKDLAALEGGWRQIWTDEVQPQPPGLRTDPAQVYQVIEPGGYYYNYANVKLLGFINAVGVLRGEYKTIDGEIKIRFTKDGFRLDTIGARTDIVQLTRDIESGKTSLIDTPGGGKAPNGPIGITGSLRTIYLDGDFRLELGDQDPFVDENGTVLVQGSKNKLFVLDRTRFGVN